MKHVKYYLTGLAAIALFFILTIVGVVLMEGYDPLEILFMIIFGGIGLTMPYLIGYGIYNDREPDHDPFG